jgi:Tol biopolymer transport system component
MRCTLPILLLLAACDVDDPHYSDVDAGDDVDAREPDGGAGCEDLIAFTRSDGLYVVDPAGADFDTVASGMDEHEPLWSPDGSKLLFERYIGGMESGATDLFSVNADGTGATNLTNIDGHDRLATWSPDGSKIAFMSQREDDNTSEDLYVMNADGSNPVRIAVKAGGGRASWSPSGDRIAYASYVSGRFQIWVSNPDGTDAVNISSNSFSDSVPVWSPDGTKIAFNSLRGGFGVAVWVMSVDGSQPENLTPSFASAAGFSWSPDSSRLVLHGGVSADDGPDVYIVDVATGTLDNLTDATDAAMYSEQQATWSPDGAQVAFQGDADGNQEIYRINADGTGLVRLTTSDFQAEQLPAWRRCP